MNVTAESLFRPFVEAARLVKHVGVRIDAMSIDLARDAGAIARHAQAFGAAARDQAATVTRAVPRVTRLAQIGAALFARARWLALSNAARTGDPALTDDDHRDLARRAVAHAAELRGGVAKLGQLASCRPDLIGAIWARELAALQDDVPAVDAAAIRQRIEHELGKPIAELYATFDDVPIAAASLAQVHGATLLDGTRVVVKVQVPGIEDVIAADIAALRTLAMRAELPGTDLRTLAEELSRALAGELDYVAEASALRRYDGRVIIPQPIEAASNVRVLTMTRIDGERLSTWLDRAAPADRDRLLGELVGEVVAQILGRGQVHADPHPGNFLVVGDRRLALLDFGCTLELTAAERRAYARLVFAIASGNHAAAAAELAALGFTADEPDRLVELAVSITGGIRPGANGADFDRQAAFTEQVANAKRLAGLELPRSFVLLARVLAAIGGMLATYKPRLELHALVAPHLAAAMA